MLLQCCILRLRGLSDVPALNRLLVSEVNRLIQISCRQWGQYSEPYQGRSTIINVWQF